MINIYDSANQVATDFQKLDEFKALENAVNAVKNNEESAALFKQMDEMQTKIINSQTEGRDFPKDLEEDYKKLKMFKRQLPDPLMTFMTALEIKK